MAALARIPLLHQPGEAWLYNTCSDILGVLIARVSGRPLPEFLAERLFGPLGMADTGFEVPASKLDRFTSYYRTGPAGGLELVDAPGGQWSSRPAFPSGAGGLVFTADDWHRFARMLLAGGSAGGRQLLSAGSVRQMTTDQLTPSQRDASRLFLEGQGWGFGGSVDVEALDPWNVPGRYGWVGGTGTAAHVTASTGTVAILLSQLAQPAGTGRPDPARPDAGVLAARGDHLKPGRVRPAAPPPWIMKSQSRSLHATSGTHPPMAGMYASPNPSTKHTASAESSGH
jgi:CubicO group peptidase (beta-lactamase class C family)